MKNLTICILAFSVLTNNALAMEAGSAGSDADAADAAGSDVGSEANDAASNDNDHDNDPGGNAGDRGGGNNGNGFDVGSQRDTAYCPQTISGLKKVYYTDELDDPQYFSWKEFNDSISWPTVRPPLKYDQDPFYREVMKYGTAMYVHAGIVPVSEPEGSTQRSLFKDQEAMLRLEGADPGEYVLRAGENACWKFTIHDEKLRSAIESHNEDKNNDGIKDDTIAQKVMNFFGDNFVGKATGESVELFESLFHGAADGIASVRTKFMSFFGKKVSQENLVFTDLNISTSGSNDGDSTDQARTNRANITSDSRYPDLVATISTVEVSDNTVLVQGFLTNEGNAFAMLPSKLGSALQSSVDVDYGCDGSVEVEKKFTINLGALANNGVRLPFSTGFAADESNGHCLSVTVDSQDVIVELNEDNNTSGQEAFAIDASSIPNRIASLASNGDESLSANSQTTAAEISQSPNIDLSVRKIERDNTDESIAVFDRPFKATSDPAIDTITIGGVQDIALTYVGRGFDRCVSSFFDTKGAIEADTLSLGINVAEPNPGTSLRYIVRCYHGDTFEERFLTVTNQ